MASGRLLAAAFAAVLMLASAQASADLLVASDGQDLAAYRIHCWSASLAHGGHCALGTAVACMSLQGDPAEVVVQDKLAPFVSCRASHEYHAIACVFICLLLQQPPILSAAGCMTDIRTTMIRWLQARPMYSMLAVVARQRDSVGRWNVSASSNVCLRTTI